jgi:excisionase family DNA binding protein
MARPKMLTTKEAAEVMGISHRTLQRYVTEGKVRPSYRLPGGQMRWDIEDLKDQLRVKDEDE